MNAVVFPFIIVQRFNNIFLKRRILLKRQMFFLNKNVLLGWKKLSYFLYCLYTTLIVSYFEHLSKKIHLKFLDLFSKYNIRISKYIYNYKVNLQLHLDITRPYMYHLHIPNRTLAYANIGQ